MKSAELLTGASFDENVLKHVIMTMFGSEMLHKNVCRVKFHMCSALSLKDLLFDELTEAERGCAAVILLAVV